MPRFLPLACLLFLAAPASVQAQELQCTVNVDFSQLQNTNVSDVAFLNDFGIEVGEYLNNQRWTNDRFEEVERIACSFVIAFTERPTQTTFRARLVVTSQRPIYGTRQSTSMLKVADEGWDFEYVQGQSLTRDPNRIDRLTALLDYYAYLILGYDSIRSRLWAVHRSSSRRSTSSHGLRARPSTGGPRSEQPHAIADRPGTDGSEVFACPPGVLRGSPSGRRRVHRRSRDRPNGRSRGAEIVRRCSPAQAANPYVLDIFFDTKSVAIVGMLSRSSQSSEAYALLLTLDPTRSSAYGALVN